MSDSTTPAPRIDILSGTHMAIALNDESLMVKIPSLNRLREQIRNDVERNPIPNTGCSSCGKKNALRRQQSWLFNFLKVIYGLSDTELYMFKRSIGVDWFMMQNPTNLDEHIQK